MKRLPKPVRKLLPILLVSATAGLFIYLFATHPQYRQTLLHTNFWILALIILLYAVMIGLTNWMYDVTLRMCGHHLPARENILLTCYTSIVNFFGPLQGGLGVRAAYLKQKLGLRLRDYTLATFVYYAMYAVINALFILVGSGKHWPIALLLFILVTFGCGAILYITRKRVLRSGESAFRMTPALLGELFLATFCQVAALSLIYWVELRAVHTGASILQGMVYGGAANFALFVALTPGAIGFREAFLAFSRELHHIPTSGILAASVIDRSVYVVFLGLLFLLIVTLHVGDRFKRASEAAASEQK
ncbi:MAG TPA: lysylphosphatidylglycerol synthase domain-containing protein [Verrucomicrobiae bacterium]|nr:lysylphosphatidylglycerol synthase domain-containing protein [Verrucomicrobiae bacterium]